MRNTSRKMARNLAARNASLVLLAILMMLSVTLATASANSLSVETDKDTYNMGDSVSVFGTATPNASASIKLFDPSNVTKSENETQVTSNGNYSIEDIYVLKVTDEPGTWRVNVCDLSSNETAEATFEVIALWEWLETLESQVANLLNKTETLEAQLASLQNQTQTLEGTVETLETLVEDLSSRLSAAETSSMIAYGAIVTSVVAVALSVVAITRKR